MKWLVDTNIIVDHLAGRLAQPLPEGDLYYSVISELECLSRQDLDDAGTRTVRDFLSTMSVAELTEAVRMTTIAIRRTRSIKLPDAIILATAHALDATLPTNDEQLLRVEGVVAARMPVRPEP